MQIQALTHLAALLAIASAGVNAVPVKSRAGVTVDPSLVPPFGIIPGQNPTGTGGPPIIIPPSLPFPREAVLTPPPDCKGANGIAIPCTCPPDRSIFIASLEANLSNDGVPVNNPDAATITFPTGGDRESVLARLTACTITLQNINGPGVGCPQASTTFAAQIAAAQALPN
ncbi:hypothetical protein MNV49_006287 [Pseudohyphozyma bogoriensis]|nr:hypothetical protein MNV49_006287 [Pseudohyphozyma bogoriensis]